MTTCGATSNDKVDTMTTLCFPKTGVVLTYEDKCVGARLPGSPGRGGPLIPEFVDCLEK